MEYLKTFEQFLLEAKGVPRGMDEIVEYIYDFLLHEYKRQKNTLLISKNKQNKNIFNIEYVIDINDINKHSYDDFGDGYIGWRDKIIHFILVLNINSNRLNLFPISTKYYVNNIDGKYKIYFEFDIEENENFNDFYLGWIRYKYTILEFLSHELMHIYDFNNKSYNIINRKLYDLHDNFNYIKKSNDLYWFIYGYYYLSDIENRVKPSQIQQTIKKTKDTSPSYSHTLHTKTDFTMINLNFCRKLTYQQIYFSLMSDYENVLDIMKKRNIHIDNEDIITHGEQNVKLFLEFIYKEICYYVPKFYRTYGNDYVKFYETEIKKMNFTADKVFKKLAKLYT